MGNKLDGLLNHYTTYDSNRREFLVALASLVAGVAGGISAYKAINNPDDEERIRTLKTAKDPLNYYVNGVPLFTVQFRNHVFHIYDVKCEKEGENPTVLINKGIKKYNPNRDLKISMFDAQVLFNILNNYDLDKQLTPEQIKSFLVKTSPSKNPTPNVRPPYGYRVPILTPYKSLEDMLSFNVRMV